MLTSRAARQGPRLRGRVQGMNGGVDKLGRRLGRREAKNLGSGSIHPQMDW